MNMESLTLSVRLRHPTMSPELISSSMGVDAVAAHAVGNQRMSPSGRKLGDFYNENYWAYRLVDRTDSDIAGAIEEANSWMHMRLDFITDFVRSGGTVEYYVSVSSSRRLAVEFSTTLLEQCNQLRANLSFEIFYQ